MSRSEIASSTRGVLAAGWVGSHGSGGEGTGVTGATGVTTGATVLGPRSPQRLQGFPIVRGQEKPSQAGIRLWSRSEEHTSELQSLMRISYAVFCLKKKK